MNVELELASVVRVIDGDTIMVRRRDSSVARVRLIGIDAPESACPEPERNTPEGQLSCIFMQALLQPGRTIWLQRDVSEADEYGRLLRYVWLTRPDHPLSTGQIRTYMVNAIMVREGYARSCWYDPDCAIQLFLDALGKEAIRQGKGVALSWTKCFQRCEQSSTDSAQPAKRQPPRPKRSQASRAARVPERKVAEARAIGSTVTEQVTRHEQAQRACADAKTAFATEDPGECLVDEPVIVRPSAPMGTCFLGRTTGTPPAA